MESISDPCVFISKEMIILVYVDDCILISKEALVIQKFISSLKAGTEDSPTVNWISFRFLIIVAQVLELDTQAIGFVLAFPQAKL